MIHVNFRPSSKLVEAGVEEHSLVNGMLLPPDTVLHGKVLEGMFLNVHWISFIQITA